MALIECPECRGKVSDRAFACPHCGCPVESNGGIEGAFCPYCGKRNNHESTYCGYCGSPLAGQGPTAEADSSDEQMCQRRDISSVAREKKIELEQIKTQQAQTRLLDTQRNQMESAPRCPKCGSASLSCGKKGFGVGKAVTGLVVAGPIGLLAGGIGMQGVQITCMSCGHKFTPKGK